MGRDMQAEYKIVPRAMALAGNQQANTKSAALTMLAEVFAGAYGVDADEVGELLAEREALGSTGFGGGVAFPHARLPRLDRPVAALVRLEEPIVFGSADAMPVDLLFGLLSPEGSGAAHLYALAAMSRLMRTASVPDALRGARDADGLFAALTNVDRQDAA